VEHRAAVIAANFLPAALAAKAATQTIPIVFLSGSDPIGAGLVSSILPLSAQGGWFFRTVGDPTPTDRQSRILITICELFRNTTNSGSRPVTSISATMTFLHMSSPAVIRAAIKSASKYIARLVHDAEDHAGAGVL
jgi:hypothetical protein